MAKKACLNCNRIYEGDKCPECGSNESSDGWKGKVEIVNPDKSEIAQKVAMKKKGTYAIKTK
ncbi:MAG: DNA-directed RNA polymerase subunit E'' [Nanoarchaeota archaeon]|nr:DNA-directed RNA polymerase subunit E'' [Nanoarchaeota archaeon]